MMSGRLGPRGPLPQPTTDSEVVHCSLLRNLNAPALVLVGDDREMTDILGKATHAILHFAADFSANPNSLYAIPQRKAGGDESKLLVRGIRQGRTCTYLRTGLNWDRPDQWQVIPKMQPLLGVVPVCREPDGYYSMAIPAAAAAS